MDHRKETTSVTQVLPNGELVTEILTCGHLIAGYKIYNNDRPSLS